MDINRAIAVRRACLLCKKMSKCTFAILMGELNKDKRVLLIHVA